MAFYRDENYTFQADQALSALTAADRAEAAAMATATTPPPSRGATKTPPLVTGRDVVTAVKLQPGGDSVEMLVFGGEGEDGRATTPGPTSARTGGGGGKRKKRSSFLESVSNIVGVNGGGAVNYKVMTDDKKTYRDTVIGV